MNDILVTVIVPVYNAEPYLKRCADSILNQKHQKLEVILIDDGSWDGSAEMCDMLGSTYSGIVQIIVIHQKNSGPSAARNAGMSLASGKFFVCVDSDDTVDPEYVYELLKAQIEHPEVGYVWCGFQKIENDAVTQRVVFSEQEIFSIVSRDQYMLTLSRGFAQSLWLHLFRTDIVQKNHIKMPADLSLGEDFIMNLQYMDAVGDSSILLINRPLYHYIFSNDQSLVSKYRPDLYQINTRLIEATKACLEKWKTTDESWQLFWDWAYVYYDATIANYRRKDAGLSYREQAKMINRVLRGKGFQESLRKTKKYINPMIKTAYRLKSYACVRFVENLAVFKNRVGS